MLARESATLGAALRALEVEHDPASALQHLDTYDRQFPSGQLAAEAKLARAQALVGAGRADDALAFLEGAALPGASRSGELLVLRGELRAARGRCSEALADFDHARARWPEGPRAERALFGSASCRARLGDVTRARGELEEYVRRFPGGRFAQQARRALETAR